MKLAPRLAAVFGFLTIVSTAGRVRAATFVVPNANAASEANGADNFTPGNPCGQQQIFVLDAGQFGALGAGDVLTGFAFRPDVTFCPGFPCGAFAATTLHDVTITLATTTTAANDTSDGTFAHFLTTNAQTVFTGDVTVSSSFTGPGSGPKDFDIVFPFTTPYAYAPASGNLVVNLAITSTDGLPSVIDGATGNPATSRIFGCATGPASTTGIHDQTAVAVLQFQFATPAPTPTNVTPTPTPTRSASATPTATGGLAGSATPTPTPTFSGVPLGHFVGYQAKVAKSGPRFFKLGPVTLADPTFDVTTDYDVLKPSLLALPANKNGEGFTDPATHLVAYAVKPAKGSPKFAPRIDVRVANQCGELTLTAKKPVSLLVPTGVDVAQPAPNDVDHFLCYQVKVQKKLASGTPVAAFPKGVQADVADAFQTRRYDLKKVVSLCLPVAKTGSPQLLAGPSKGVPFPLAPSTVGNPGAFLVCYQAKLATKTIAQNGCGPANAVDKGTKIVPKQAKHGSQLVQVGNQLGGQALDTKKESLLCIPSSD
jgi:hypothetical protein